MFPSPLTATRVRGRHLVMGDASFSPDVITTDRIHANVSCRWWWGRFGKHRRTMLSVREFLIAGLIAACLLAGPASCSAGSGVDRPGTHVRKSSPSKVNPGESFSAQFNLPRDPESVLHEILSRSEFQEGLRETLWDRIEKRLEQALIAILTWIAQKLGSMMGSELNFDPHPLWRVGEGLLIGAAILLAITLATPLFEFLRDRMGAPAQPAAPRAEMPVYVSGSKLREEAIRMALAGDYRGAVILLFRSVLVRLEEEGKISHHTGKTNREILRSIPEDSGVRQTVQHLVPVFDGVCYGKAPCGKEEYERFLGLCTRLIQGD